MASTGFYRIFAISFKSSERSFYGRLYCVVYNSEWRYGHYHNKTYSLSTAKIMQNPVALVNQPEKVLKCKLQAADHTVVSYCLQCATTMYSVMAKKKYSVGCGLRVGIN